METRALLFYSGIMEWIKRGEATCELDSDCGTAATCEGRHDFIRTLFWAFKYIMESFYFQMDPASPPYLFGVGRNRRNITESESDSGAATPYFGPMGRVSS